MSIAMVLEVSCRSVQCENVLMCLVGSRAAEFAFCMCALRGIVMFVMMTVVQ